MGDPLQGQDGVAAMSGAELVRRATERLGNLFGAAEHRPASLFDESDYTRPRAHLPMQGRDTRPVAGAGARAVAVRAMEARDALAHLRRLPAFRTAAGVPARGAAKISDVASITEAIAL